MTNNYFDVNDDSESVFSENPYISDPKIMSEMLNKKIEAQKYALGLGAHNPFNVTFLNLPETPTITYEDTVETHPKLNSNIDVGTPNQAGFVMLPERGYGWISNPGSPDSHRWGRPKVIQALIAIAKEWKDRGNPLPLVYGDISLRTGGRMPGHRSHQIGLDIDIRPIGMSAGRVTTSYNYNRTKTQELIDLIKNNGIISVGIIGFQDPLFVSQGITANWDDHKDHMHVRFKE